MAEKNQKSPWLKEGKIEIKRKIADNIEDRAKYSTEIINKAISDVIDDAYIKSLMPISSQQHVPSISIDTSHAKNVIWGIVDKWGGLAKPCNNQKHFNSNADNWLNRYKAEWIGEYLFYPLLRYTVPEHIGKIIGAGDVNKNLLISVSYDLVYVTILNKMFHEEIPWKRTRNLPLILKQSFKRNACKKLQGLLRELGNKHAVPWANSKINKGEESYNYAKKWVKQILDKVQSRYNEVLKVHGDEDSKMDDDDDCDYGTNDGINNMCDNNPSPQMSHSTDFSHHTRLSMVGYPTHSGYDNSNNNGICNKNIVTANSAKRHLYKKYKQRAIYQPQQTQNLGMIKHLEHEFNAMEVSSYSYSQSNDNLDTICYHQNCNNTQIQPPPNTFDSNSVPPVNCPYVESVHQVQQPANQSIFPYQAPKQQPVPAHIQPPPITVGATQIAPNSAGPCLNALQYTTNTNPVPPSPSIAAVNSNDNLDSIQISNIGTNHQEYTQNNQCQDWSFQSTSNSNPAIPAQSYPQAQQSTANQSAVPYHPVLIPGHFPPPKLTINAPQIQANSARKYEPKEFRPNTPSLSSSHSQLFNYNHKTVPKQPHPRPNKNGPRIYKRRKPVALPNNNNHKHYNNHLDVDSNNDYSATNSVTPYLPPTPVDNSGRSILDHDMLDSGPYLDGKGAEFSGHQMSGGCINGSPPPFIPFGATVDSDDMMHDLDKDDGDDVH